MIKFIEKCDLTLKTDGDRIILSGLFNLEEGEIHNVCYIIQYNDMKDFIEGNESNIIANDDTVYINFIRGHVIIEEELESERIEFAIDDCTDLFNMIASWWHNH